MLAFLIRIGIYFDVHSAIKEVDIEHVDNGFGSFAAEYIEDTTGSAIITAVLLLAFLSFYLSNFWIVRLMSKLIDFMNNKMEEHLISQSILLGRE